MERRISFKNSAGQRLAGVLHRPEGATAGIVLCHGFGSTKDNAQYADLAKKLADAGVAALRFDFSGSGKSGGTPEEATVSQYMDDAQQAIAVLKKQKVSAIGLYGSSLGGMVAALVAAQDPLIRSLILRAPVCDFTAVWDAIAGKAALSQWKKKRTMTFRWKGKNCRMKYRFYEDGRRRDVYGEARQIACPTLIIHGSDDDIVPLEQSWELMKSIPNARIEVIQQAGHSFDQETMEMVECLAVEWGKASLK